MAAVKEHIDYWLLLDTGSNDTTIDQMYQGMWPTPGEAHLTKFIDFSISRNTALQVRPRCAGTRTAGVTCQASPILRLRGTDMPMILWPYMLMPAVMINVQQYRQAQVLEGLPCVGLRSEPARLIFPGSQKLPADKAISGRLSPLRLGFSFPVRTSWTIAAGEKGALTHRKQASMNEVLDCMCGCDSCTGSARSTR